MELKQNIVDLSAAQRKKIKLEVAKDGTSSWTGLEELYPDALGEDDLGHDKRISEKRSAFFVATAKTIGEVTLEAMKKKPELQSVEAIVPLHGKDTFVVGIERVKEFPKPGSKEGEKITQYGVLSAELNTVGATVKRGQMKAVREALQEQYAAALNS